MPAKIKWIWVFCCVIVFFGFIYLSMKAEIKEAKLKAREKKIEKVDKSIRSAKKFQRKEFQVSREIKEIREFIALGRYEEAANLAKKVIERNPENAKVYTWWGISLVRMKQLDEAIKRFLKSSKLDPGQPRTFLYWGLTLSMQKQYKKAIAKYKIAIQLDPKNSSAYAYWGGALADLNKHTEAVTKLQKSLDLNPFNGIAYNALVNILYHTGHYQKAWKTVFKARQLNVTIAEEILKRLSKTMPEPAL